MSRFFMCKAWIDIPGRTHDTLCCELRGDRAIIHRKNGTSKLWLIEEKPVGEERIMQAVARGNWYEVTLEQAFNGYSIPSELRPLYVPTTSMEGAW